MNSRSCSTVNMPTEIYEALSLNTTYGGAFKDAQPTIGNEWPGFVEYDYLEEISLYLANDTDERKEQVKALCRELKGAHMNVDGKEVRRIEELRYDGRGVQNNEPGVVAVEDKDDGGGNDEDEGQDNREGNKIQDGESGGVPMDEGENEGDKEVQVEKQGGIGDDMETDDNAEAVDEGAKGSELLYVNGILQTTGGDVGDVSGVQGVDTEYVERQFEAATDTSFGNPEEDMAQAEREMAARALAAAQLTEMICDAQNNRDNPDQMQHGTVNQDQMHNDDSGGAQVQDEGDTSEQQDEQLKPSEGISQDDGGERE
jgi:hypothetical protein